MLSFPLPLPPYSPPSLSLLCADPILIARALQDYYPGDCRFIPIRQGQLIYVYAMLKGRGNLYWAGSVGSEPRYQGSPGAIGCSTPS